MIKELREKYNNEFTNEKYLQFINDCNKHYNYEIDFRISETPVFISKEFKNMLIEASDEIIETLLQPNFKDLTQNAVPKHLKVPNEDGHTSLLAIDFAICEDGNGGLIPQLIELQGFASLFCYQEWISEKYKKHFNIPENFDNKFSGYTHETYIERLKQIIIGDAKPEEVILLEIDPWNQKTQIDFYCSQEYLGIAVVCLSEVIKEGRNLFYINKGIKTQIKRIYNRVIFDELEQKKEFVKDFNITDDVNVEWIAHPNWFFRISKYTMPFLKSKYVPETYFLNEVTEQPLDLENWVIKPLFSFSGQGVIFDVTPEDYNKIIKREDYILQRKVTYAQAVQSPTGGVKCEIRLLYLWDKNETKPELTINLGRMSKGKMIGVRYNQNLDWVGGTSYFLEKD